MCYESISAGFQSTGYNKLASSQIKARCKSHVTSFHIVTRRVWIVSSWRHGEMDYLLINWSPNWWFRLFQCGAGEHEQQPRWCKYTHTRSKNPWYQIKNPKFPSVVTHTCKPGSLPEELHEHWFMVVSVAQEFIAVRVQDPRVQNEGSWNSYVDFKIFLHVSIDTEMTTRWVGLGAAFTREQRLRIGRKTGRSSD